MIFLLLGDYYFMLTKSSNMLLSSATLDIYAAFYLLFYAYSIRMSPILGVKVSKWFLVVIKGSSILIFGNANFPFGCDLALANTFVSFRLYFFDNGGCTFLLLFEVSEHLEATKLCDYLNAP